MKKRFCFAVHVLFIITIVLCWASLGIADTFIVTKTDDSGAGSLRQAVLDAEANAGPDTIIFNIPAEATGYNPTTGVWRIQPTSALPDLSSDGTFIDGTTQSAFIGGDPNPLGPEILVDGSLSGADNGFWISGSNNVLRDLRIHLFNTRQVYIDQGDSNAIIGCTIGPDPTGNDRVENDAHGIYIFRGSHNIIGGESEAERNVISGNGQSGILIKWESESNHIVGNYIGTDYSGTDTLGNKYGIRIETRSKCNTVGPLNVVSGNEYNGIYIVNSGTDSNRVMGNYIGTDKTGSYALGDQQGIYIDEGGKWTIIGGENEGEGNIISGNSVGIRIMGGGADENRIIGNKIGTDVSGTFAIKNQYEGVSISYGAKNNMVGPGNLIAFNGGDGVEVIDEESVGNTITQNSIHSNEGLGIKNWNGGNAELSPPVITEVGSVSGTAPANSTVEIFSGPDDEGKTYEGTVTADDSGNFTWAATVSGRYVTATATDSTGNTSEFSAVFDTPVETEEEVIVPDEFSLCQNYPNPFNPETTIRFGVKEPCRVVLKVYDVLGREVATLVDEHREAGWYRSTFDVAGFASGIYFYQIRMGDFQAVKKMVVLE